MGRLSEVSAKIEGLATPGVPEQQPETSLRKNSAVYRRPVRSKVMLLLRIVDAAAGEIDASDHSHSMLNYFCGDYEPTDTFNEAVRLGFLRTSFDSFTESSTAYLTERGRSALAAAKGGAS